MRSPRALPFIILLVGLAACGGGSSNPAGPEALPTAIEGRTLDAISGSGTGSTVRVGLQTMQTDAEGYFRMDVGTVGEFAAHIQGNGYVERQTRVRTARETQRLPLIPTSYDLASFDEMFRPEGTLQRWTRRPVLTLLTSVMRYPGPSEPSYAATGERLSDAELDQMEAHFTEGLRLLTGGQFTSFEAIRREQVAEGERATVLRDGEIVVGRYLGIIRRSQTIGLGRWQLAQDYSVTGGTVLLDSEFDRDDWRRRLLRIHELGHALGYMHVNRRESIMNAVIGPEPTDLDRHGATIAFQRLPGNRPPDIDPAPGASGQSLTPDGSRRWSPPVICGMPR